MPAEIDDRSARILWVGADPDKSLERRLAAAGCVLVKAVGDKEALEHARRDRFEAAVLAAEGSLISVAETIFNLRDVNEVLEIIVLVDARRNSKDPFFQQLKIHPISRTRIMTRRELRKELHSSSPHPRLKDAPGRRRGAA